MRQRPQSAGPDFHKSFSVQSLSVVPPTTTTTTTTTGTTAAGVSGGSGVVASSSSGTGGGFSTHRGGPGGGEIPGGLLPVGGGLAATRQRIADTRARLQAFFREGVEPGKGGVVGGSGHSSGGGGVVSVQGKKETEAETDIRRTWAAVLKVSPSMTLSFKIISRNQIISPPLPSFILTLNHSPQLILTQTSPHPYPYPFTLAGLSSM